jgi:rhodanese-related sulfurtransferase
VIALATISLSITILEATMKTISADALYAAVQSGRAPLLLEALPERYYAKNHLPGALLFPHDQVDQRAAGAIPHKSTPVVVYCASRACQNSRIAAQRLVQLGYTDVAVYEGGKQEWEQSGFPFEAEAATDAAA